MRSCKIILGEKNEGKSTLINSLIANDKSSFHGFVSDKDEDGYLLRSLATGKSRRYLSKSIKFEDTLGYWYFDSSCFSDSYKELENIKEGTIYLDEVGRLELQGGGFDSVLHHLIPRDIDLVITVRNEYLSSVIERYRFDNAQIIRVNRDI